MLVSQNGNVQSQEKREEGLRGGWVGVSIGFPFGGLGEPNIYQNLVYFTRNGDFTWRVSDYEELSGCLIFCQVWWYKRSI